MDNNLLYHCLKQVYNNISLKPNIKVFDFSPNLQKIEPDIHIDGLYTPGHYVNKGYNTLTNLCIIDFNKLGYKVVVKIYFSNKIPNMRGIIIEIILRIYTMLYLFETEKIPYEIVMLLYELPRIIPCCFKKGRNEINTIGELGLFNCTNGYYQDQGNKKFIVITRYNDCMGLLIHELSHAVGLDVGAYDTFKQWEDFYYERFNGKAGHFTEGINNATASIIHCMLLSIKYNKDFYAILKKEKEYVYKCCCKLIKFYVKDEDKKEYIIDDLKGIYTQLGQMFEYNILRYIYLENCDNFYNFKNINHLTEKEKKILTEKIPQGFCHSIMWMYTTDKNTMNNYFNLFINKLQEQKFNIIGLKDDYTINGTKFFNMDYFNMNFNLN